MKPSKIRARRVCSRSGTPSASRFGPIFSPRKSRSRRKRARASTSKSARRKERNISPKSRRRTARFSSVFWTENFPTGARITRRRRGSISSRRSRKNSRSSWPLRGRASSTTPPEGRSRTARKANARRRESCAKRTPRRRPGWPRLRGASSWPPFFSRCSFS